jgi:hypothetical protein
MKKAIGFILLQFIALPAIMAQGNPTVFEDDVNDNAPAAPIDDYIMVGIVVAVILTILIVRLKLTKANISQH